MILKPKHGERLTPYDCQVNDHITFISSRGEKTFGVLEKLTIGKEHVFDSVLTFRTRSGGTISIEYGHMRIEQIERNDDRLSNTDEFYYILCR